MSILLKTTLIAHVVFGLIGVIALYATLMTLLRKTPSTRALMYTSVTAFISIVISWLTGGYYYVLYYGGAVKPLILKGQFTWAHLIATEAKEHFFLFLPFATLVLLITIYYHGDRLVTDERLRKSIALLAGVGTVIGTFTALAGIMISGGAR